MGEWDGESQEPDLEPASYSLSALLGWRFGAWIREGQEGGALSGIQRLFVR